MIFAVAVVTLPNLTTLAFLATLRQYRARKTAISRMGAGLRFAFNTGRLVPVHLPVE